MTLAISRYYAISEEIEPGRIVGGSQGSLERVDNIDTYETVASTVILNTNATNTVYKYKSKFIGYVLNTSITQ